MKNEDVEDRCAVQRTSSSACCCRCGRLTERASPGAFTRHHRLLLGRKIASAPAALRCQVPLLQSHWHLGCGNVPQSPHPCRFLVLLCRSCQSSSSLSCSVFHSTATTRYVLFWRPLFFSHQSHLPEVSLKEETQHPLGGGGRLRDARQTNVQCRRREGSGEKNRIKNNIHSHLH